MKTETIPNEVSEPVDVLAHASDCIRKNPLSSVVGAAVFGLAVGCLIMSGRHEPTLQERFVGEPLEHANDVLSNISENLSRLVANLKFW